MRDFQLPGRSPVLATNGMCATSHPLASSVAVDILKNGGNAVDAAIAAAFMLGLCEPQSTGIGGDCFVLLKPAGTENIIALNASGKAPAATDPDKLRASGRISIDVQSPDAVTVPGAIDGFCRLSQDWGKVGLAASLAPAIRYAREGIPVAPRVAFDYQRKEKRLQGEARKFYLFGDKPAKTGDIFRHPQQAEVLEEIASHGRAGFYEGDVAEDMVTSLRAVGGGHTLDDFAETACEYTDPISGAYRGVELVEHPPNGQGATAILMANMLSHFDVAAMDAFGAARAHLETEVAKLAYDARDRFIADMNHCDRVEHMLAADTAGALAALVDPNKASGNTRERTEAVHKDTVYLCVVDRDGMAVSMIYSIFDSFGSGLASSRYGVLFQNRGSGFNLEKGHPNEAGPSKRPLHTIIPGMLRQNGMVIMPFGVMGGQYQPAGHMRFLSNRVDFGMDPQEAMDGPRLFSDAGDLKVERGYGADVRAKLEQLGHQVVVPAAPLGGAQAIEIDRSRGVLIGASDPRKDGLAIGY